MQCDILVGSTDALYLRALVDFLLISKNNQFNITAVEESGELRSLFRAPRFRLFLLEESLLDGIAPAELPQSHKLLILTETYTSVDTRSFMPLLKYQKASVIESMMLEKAGGPEAGERVPGHVGKTGIIGFYSPSGGTGCTTYALMYAMAKASKGYKTLFISHDSYQGYGMCMKTMSEGNMSDYLVHVLSGSNWLAGLERYMSVDEGTGLHYLAPVNHQRDMEAFDAHHWGEWLSYMASLSDYDYVVVDIGSSVFDVVTGILRACTARVFIQAGDALGDFKWRRFEHQLEAFGDGAVLAESIRLVKNAGGFSGTLSHKSVHQIGHDEEIYKTDRFGNQVINPYSRTFRQIEAVMSHV